MRLSLLLSGLLPALAVASELSLQTLKFSILGEDGSPVRSETFSDKQLPSPALSVRSSDTLRVTFTITDRKSGEGIQPHQTFIRLYDPITKEEGVQPLRVSSAGKAKFDLSMSKPPAWLPPTTDQPLEVSLIIGSFTYDPLHRKLFNLVLPRSQPAPVSPEEVHYHPQPEIQHTFRPEQKIPMKAISGIFALAMLSPWVVLLTLWLNIPHRTPKLFSSEILPFISLLAATEGLLVIYWVNLTLPQVLTYGAVLSLLTAATGKRALSTVSRWRSD
ncbi:SubName: Full=Related to oligosaccharyltransferase delta subunit (Ribophorin II) {ECO:0000313/EMBL:CCA73510.1} [Serendipita indica DSM 11827]|uniref:Ribophorin II n=1 Tax=Serendipita indica (strain DSM 11827) TaxID=1109443 RepID=G4TQB7_SERID|nr:SubName: Full=Related to oligosaccharyltransferase delta subunit (Ribophorin II) {ECO:0000313/EMBL:CCA73510.1} [Serendipita indica DSM 11827]CCA73510.1 related to oligosaccharyltransferase delta subunit (ribophorin II) [Serendipita indica DSM 11827]